MKASELVEGYPAPVFRTEVSGVPTFWSEAEPPFSATLMFRVGRADETLLTSGVTHLVEHLAMPAHARQLFEVNASVERVRTIFWAHGERDEVLEFITTTAAALASLPLERLETERRILEVEGDRFESSAYSTLLCSRFGARGLGLYDYREFGLRRITAEDVASWAETHFTAANAALWLTGPPPDGFELPLRRGAPTAPHELPDAVFELPLVVNWGYGGIALSFLPERSVAVRFGTGLVRDRIHHELRYRHGISYSTLLDYEPVNATTAHVYLSADTLAEYEERARDAVLHALDELATDGPAAEELEYSVELSARYARDPREARSWLDALATDELYGAEQLSPAGMLAAAAELRAEDIAGVVADLLETMVLCLPRDLDCPSERFKPLPEWRDLEVTGRRYWGPRTGRWKRRNEWIVVGSDGVSWTDADGSWTILFEDTAALVCDGASPIVMHRLDGRWMSFLGPADWRSGAGLLADIRAATPSGLVVDESSQRDGA